MTTHSTFSMEEILIRVCLVVGAAGELVDATIALSDLLDRGFGCASIVYATLWICSGTWSGRIISDPLIMSGQLAQFRTAKGPGRGTRLPDPNP
jgi:hypothetical protein